MPLNADITITVEQAFRLAGWIARAGIGRPDDVVRLAADDRMLVAEHRGERMGWDLGGEAASAHYLAAAPLDPTGTDRPRAA